MSSNDGYVFRRIRGRIVRIKTNQSGELKKKQLAGAGIAAAGGALAFESGNLYRNSSEAAFRNAFKGIETKERIRLKFGSNVSNDLYNKAQAKGLFSGVVSKFKEITPKTPVKEVLTRKLNYHVAMSKDLANLSLGVKKYGLYAGAGLIGYGTAKFLHNYAKDKKKSISPETVATLGVGAGGAGIYAAKKADRLFYHGFVAGKHKSKYIAGLAIEKLKGLGSALIKKAL